MKITFLGTGTSQGIPVIACECAVCRSEDLRDKRLRVSVMIESAGRTVIIDSGPDFRYQMLRAGVKRIDGIVFTHEHKDHIAGLDDVRAFNFVQKTEIDIYAEPRVQDAIRREFSYIFSDFEYPGIPKIRLNTITSEPFTVAGMEFIPVRGMHFKLPVFGFRIGGFTYLTDIKTVAEEERQKIRGCKVLVVSALQKTDHVSHFTLAEAVEFAEDIGAKKTYFTHISHRMGRHADVESELPEGMSFAYDGMVLSGVST